MLFHRLRGAFQVKIGGIETVSQEARLTVLRQRIIIRDAIERSARLLHG